jgi:hypothetical protein
VSIVFDVFILVTIDDEMVTPQVGLYMDLYKAIDDLFEFVSLYPNPDPDEKEIVEVIYDELKRMPTKQEVQDYITYDGITPKDVEEAMDNIGIFYTHTQGGAQILLSIIGNEDKATLFNAVVKMDRKVRQMRDKYQGPPKSKYGREREYTPPRREMIRNDNGRINISG